MALSEHNLNSAFTPGIVTTAARGRCHLKARHVVFGGKNDWFCHYFGGTVSKGECRQASCTCDETNSNTLGTVLHRMKKTQMLDIRIKLLSEFYSEFFSSPSFSSLTIFQIFKGESIHVSIHNMYTCESTCIFGVCAHVHLLLLLCDAKGKYCSNYSRFPVDIQTSLHSSQ